MTKLYKKGWAVCMYFFWLSMVFTCTGSARALSQSVSLHRLNFDTFLILLIGSPSLKLRRIRCFQTTFWSETISHCSPSSAYLNLICPSYIYNITNWSHTVAVCVALRFFADGIFCCCCTVSEMQST